MVTEKSNEKMFTLGDERKLERYERKPESTTNELALSWSLIWLRLGHFFTLAMPLPLSSR